MEAEVAGAATADRGTLALRKLESRLYREGSTMHIRVPRRLENNTNKCWIFFLILSARQ